MGQARKSLWIETSYPNVRCPICVGQARKSLWIETKPKACTNTSDTWSGS